MGNYTYFGHTAAELDLGCGVDRRAAVQRGRAASRAACSAAALVLCRARAARRRSGALHRAPAGGVRGAVRPGASRRSGVVSRRADLRHRLRPGARRWSRGTAQLPAYYAALKLLATVVSYVSGIPGGIFAPSLVGGRRPRRRLAHFLPAAPAGAVVLLGMVAYFSGVVQAPITASVIVMEMTDNQRVTVPLMATAFLAFGVSRLICRRPLYSALAQRFLEVQERSSRHAGG